jgi:DNA methylase
VSALYVVGDALKVMRRMPNACVELVLFSPPFLAKRRYLEDGDPAQAEELGQEPTPGEYVDAILGVVEEARRVLPPWGSIAVELGDTNAGSGGAGGDYNPGGLRDGQHAYDGTAVKARNAGGYTDRPRRPRSGRVGLERNTRRDHRQDEAGGVLPAESRWRGERDGWPLDKSLCLVPEVLRFAMVYGFNPLTGRETPRWRARNVVRWVRTNPSVGYLSDRWRYGTTEIVVACQGDRRWWDAEAGRTPLVPTNERNTVSNYAAPGQRPRKTVRRSNPRGAPPLDWWCVSPGGYRGAHFAVWPEKLLPLPIRAMCPERVCTTCGQPSERLTLVATEPRPGGGSYGRKRSAAEPDGHDRGLSSGPAVVRVAKTLGWSHCACGDGCRPTRWEKLRVEVEEVRVEGRWEDAAAVDDPPEDAPRRERIKNKRVVVDVGECRDPSHWRPGRVLDSFAGTGTTLLVANAWGRDALGIDLDAGNVELARERCGLFFREVSAEDLAAELAPPEREPAP